ncbi:DUF2336 domain-containing protein [Methylobacterium sp. D48H]
MSKLAQAATLSTELLYLIEKCDVDKQVQFLRASAAALVEYWSRLPEEERSSYDIMLARLLSKVDEESRYIFALRIIELKRPPMRTAILLAQDRSLRIATLIVIQMQNFKDEWLLGVAINCSNMHRAAIARRDGLCVSICDTLIRLGDASVAAAVLSNSKACISTENVPLLMQHASQSEEVAIRLITFVGLPASYRNELLEYALERARESLREDTDVDPTIVEALPERIAALLSAPVAPARLARFQVSMSIAGELLVKPVSSDRLERWVELRRLEDVLAILAYEAGLPIGSVVAAYDAEDSAALAVILRGLGRPWTTLKALLSARSREVISPATVLACHNLMIGLGSATARRLIRFAMAKDGRTAYLAQFSCPPNR